MIITITKAEYEELLLDSNRYEMLLDSLYENAGLNWNGESLEFDDEKLCDLLKLIDRFNYEKRFKELNKEKQDEQKEEK